MTENEKKNRPDYRSKAYNAMARFWPYVSDVIAGTLRLRELKGKYLPKFPAEDVEVYNDRVSTAVCFERPGKPRTASSA